MAVVRKLVVEVVDARNLLPKDGHGASSPYVVLDFHGQRRKTRAMIRDLNPVWNETLEFNVVKASELFGDMLELDVFHDRILGPTTRNNFLGRVKLSSRQFVKKGEEALIYYPLEKKNWFSWIQGEIGLRIYFVDEIATPPPPPPPPAAPTPPPEEVKPDQTSAMSDDKSPPAETDVAAAPPPSEAETNESPPAPPSEPPPAPPTESAVPPSPENPIPQAENRASPGDINNRKLTLASYLQERSNWRGFPNLPWRVFDFVGKERVGWGKSKQ